MGIKKKSLVIATLIVCLVAFCFVSAACDDPSTVIESIAVTNAPSTKTYIVGEKFNPKNMVVTATYKDGSTAVVTNECILSPDKDTPLTVDITEITITYDGMTTSTPITVNPVSATSLTITKLPNKLSYGAGETFDPTGMTIKANYNNGTTGDISLLDCSFEFTANGDGVKVTSGSASTIFSIKKSLEAKNFGSYFSGNVETGSNAIGGFPFWTANSWGKIGTAPTNYTASGSFNTSNRCGVTVSNDELTFTEATAGWTPALYLNVGSQEQSQPLLAGYDGIFTKAATEQDGNTFQYSFNVKATGNFNFLLWNTSNVISDFSAGSAGFKLAHADGKFTFSSRGGDLASVSDMFNEYKDNEWNRVDIFTTRAGGYDNGKVTLVIYINGFRIIWDNAAPGSYGSFVDGNYVGNAFQNSNAGPRFSVLPEGESTVSLKKV